MSDNKQLTAPAVGRGLKLEMWIRRYWQLTLMLLVPMIFVLVFSYGPMYGLLIAFKNYRGVDGIWGSKWVGLDHFIKFFESYQFKRVMVNTIALSLYSLLVGFPIPILFAIALNCVSAARFKKVVQMATYAPYFISTVVLVSIVTQVLAPKYGLVNNVITALGGDEVMFMAEGTYFRSIYVWSGIWQSMGFSAIIYISALSGIDPSLHEAAIIDGASRVSRVWHIDIPGILPTIVILLILSCGSLLNVGFEKVLLMQNATNTEYSEVISTLIYKLGIAGQMPNYSYTTAIGLFNNIINFGMLVIVNFIARRLGETSLW